MGPRRTPADARHHLEGFARSLASTCDHVGDDTVKLQRMVRMGGSLLTRANVQRLAGREPTGFADHYESTLRSIEGWRYRQDLALLYALARDVPGDETVLEIGSFKGLATTALALGVRDRPEATPVHTVDPHTGDKQDLEWSGLEVKPSEADFRQNIAAAGVADDVTAHVMTSDQLASEWDGSRIRVLFIDGWHGYEAVRSDIANWVPLLSDQGVVVIDDYLNYDDVRRAVDESDALAKLRLRRAGRMKLGHRSPLPEQPERLLTIPWG